MLVIVFFFFIDTPTTEIYTLSLHDALPISRQICAATGQRGAARRCGNPALPLALPRDRKSTRQNSSHVSISYAVFCLKKKKRNPPPADPNVPLAQAPAQAAGGGQRPSPPDP